jgi:hypothetical protein
VASAELFGLLDPVNAIIAIKLRDDFILAMSDDDKQAIASRLEAGAHDVFQHRPAADFMQRFGSARFHSRRLPGGEDDGRNGHIEKI